MNRMKDFLSAHSGIINLHSGQISRDINVYLIVTQRIDFAEKWQATLSHRGRVVLARSLAELQFLLRSEGVIGVVIDHALTADAEPEFLQLVCRLCGKAPLIVGDSRLDPDRELLALAAGVAACCDAVMSNADLSHVMDSVAVGGVWLSRPAMQVLADRMGTTKSGTQNTNIQLADELAGLTERQRDVAILVGQGASNKVIARQLNITERTVKAHLTTIFEKLGFADRLQLALFVTRRSV